MNMTNRSNTRAMVRLGVVILSGFITLNYVELPMVKKTGASSDITFVASIFTGALATFGLSTGNKKSKDKPKQKKLILLSPVIPAVQEQYCHTPVYYRVYEQYNYNNSNYRRDRASASIRCSRKHGLDLTYSSSECWHCWW